jgi:hypothetical protein
VANRHIAAHAFIREREIDMIGEELDELLKIAGASTHREAALEVALREALADMLEIANGTYVWTALGMASIAGRQIKHIEDVLEGRP